MNFGVITRCHSDFLIIWFETTRRSRLAILHFLGEVARHLLRRRRNAVSCKSDRAPTRETEKTPIAAGDRIRLPIGSAVDKRGIDFSLCGTTERPP